MFDRKLLGLAAWAILGLAAAPSIGTAADTTAPTVEFVRPVGQQTVSGTVGVTLNVTDNVGVTKVEFYLDGDGNKLLGTDTQSPWYLHWNTDRETRGSHTLGARAYDAAGNIGWRYISINISTVSTTCQDLIVEIRNDTPRQIGGGLWGSGLGSSGWGANARQIVRQGVYAGRNTSGSYELTGNIQEYGNDRVYVNCTAKIPVVNGCPKLTFPNAFMNVVQASPTNPVPKCWINVPQ